MSTDTSLWQKIMERVEPGVHTCDTCKFWQDDDVNPDNTDESKKICQNTLKMIPPFRGGPNEDGWTVDVTFYALFTGPKFGCIHWEAKP